MANQFGVDLFVKPKWWRDAHMDQRCKLHRLVEANLNEPWAYEVSLAADEIDTLRTLRAAWEKRAYEAEAECNRLREVIKGLDCD